MAPGEASATAEPAARAGAGVDVLEVPVVQSSPSRGLWTHDPLHVATGDVAASAGREASVGCGSPRGQCRWDVELRLKLLFALSVRPLAAAQGEIRTTQHNLLHVHLRHSALRVLASLSETPRVIDRWRGCRSRAFRRELVDVKT